MELFRIFEFDLGQSYFLILPVSLKAPFDHEFEVTRAYGRTLQEANMCSVITCSLYVFFAGANLGAILVHVYVYACLGP